MTGRPRVYSEALAAALLDRLADGETLRGICRDATMPARSTVQGWMVNVGGFSARYAQARARGVEVLADEILDLSDDSSRDVHIGEDGQKIVDHEAIARSRLRVDSRKWLLSKLLPQTYGDRQQLEHSGPGGASLVPVLTVTISRE